MECLRKILLICKQLALRRHYKFQNVKFLLFLYVKTRFVI